MNLKLIRWSTWHLIAAMSLAIAIGVAIGGGFAIHEADRVIETERSVYAQQLQNASEQGASYKEALAVCISAGEGLLQRAQAGGDVNTVIYERMPPALEIKITGIHGLPVIPLPRNAHAIPRWLIPGRVTPLMLAPEGDAAPVSVYFYVGKDNVLHGPIQPEIVTPQ